MVFDSYSFLIQLFSHIIHTSQTRGHKVNPDLGIPNSEPTYFVEVALHTQQHAQKKNSYAFVKQKNK